MANGDAPPADPANGEGRQHRVAMAIIAACLGGCILISGALAGICIFKPPQDWALVSKLIDHINALTLLLAGGLLGLTKPQGSG